MRQSIKSALHSVPLLMILLLVLVQNAAAWNLDPPLVQDSEGAVVQLKITIEVDDWVKPDANFAGKCADIGISADWVARYFLKRVSGSAEFSLNETSRDLHLAFQGIPKGDLYVLWCFPGPYVTARIDTSITLNLHEDEIAEPTETASLEFWEVDLADNKTFISKIPISITDVRTSPNENECSSTPLSGDPPGATGSISLADCDDSPRGSGYLADIITFSGTKGETISLLAEWGNMDGYLYLQAPDGSIEGENDNLNNASDSGIVSTLKKTGTYKIWATTKNKNDKGDYEITVTDAPGIADDWKFTSVTVTPTALAPNDLLSISVIGQSNGTPTFFSAGPVEVVYLLSADAAISEGDTALGSETYCCASGFEDVWEGNLDVAPGTYWAGACITKADDNPANNCSSGTEITVGGSSPSTCNARLLGCGETLSGNLNEASCTAGPQGPNYYAERLSFTGAAGETFWLDANWDFDGYLMLKNSLGKVIAENDNYTSPANSHIEYTLQENGTYTVWATSYQPEAMGAYDVTLDCDPPAGPDLIVDTPVLQAEILVPGQSIELSARLHNSGNLPADATTLHFVLSSDSLIGPFDPEIGANGTPGLPAGESSTANKKLAAPITPGHYWIGVCADGVADEAAVSNNCSAGRLIEVQAQPECTSWAMSCGQLLSGTLNNNDCSRSPRGTGFLAEVLEVEIDAGRSLVADASWSGVDGYLLLEGPSGSIVASNDDANDLLHSRIEYAVENSGIHRIWTTSFQRDTTGSYELELICGSESEPDLVASEVSVSATEVNVEDTINLAAVVYNDGNSASEASTVYFMLSSDEEISADDSVMTSLSLAAIPAGSSLSTEVSVNAPEQAGNYWVGICVDAVSDETLTWNNCSHRGSSESPSSVETGSATSKSRPQSSGNTGTLIMASTGAACPSNTMSCGQNRSGTLGQDDCDKGPRGTGYFADAYSFSGSAGDRVSLNVDWTGLDGYLYLENPTGEVAGENDDFQSSEHSRIEHVLEHSGTYQVWASAHAQGQGGSYQLNFNCNAPAGPDLLVEAPQLSATTVRPGQYLSFTTQILNQGDEDSADTSVQFIIAGSSTLSFNDRVLGKSDVTALAPGETSLESMTFALDVAPGTYWAAACVDSEALELDRVDNCAVTGPFTVEQNNRPIDINPGLNDAWYNPATGGQGFFINVFPDGDQMFLSWFTYDLDRPETGVPFELGEPGHRWLIALGTYEHGVATLDIYLNQGGVFDQAQPAPTEVLYGSMTVSFSDCNHGQITFDLPSVGEQGAIPITRVATDNLKDCRDKVGIVESGSDETPVQVNGDEDIAASAFNINPGLNDAWYNPATSGQGFSFNVFPRLGTVFLSWFTYDTERPPEEVPAQLGEPGLRWLTALGQFQGDRTEMTLYRVEGGVFNSADPAPEEVEYGTVTARFDDCNSGELHYDIPSLSRQGVVPIQRLAPDTIPVCEQAQMSHVAGLLEVSPGNKVVLENFCGGASSWLFDWPDSPRASGYILELWRNDALVPMTFAVNDSEFRYEKDTAIPVGHLTGWKWRYRPQYSAFDKTAEFTEAFTFDVGTCEP